MPLLTLKTSILLPEDEQAPLVKELSRVVADTIGKPEQYVMVVLEEGAICMGGQCAPAAFVDVKSIGGLSRDTNQRLSAAVCDCLNAKLDLNPARVYLNFSNVSGENWGWNGSTFS